MSENLRNRILEDLYEVYACHPETYKQVRAQKDQLPFNWIVYPNPECPVGELQQADLSDENLKEFIFKEVLPRCEYVKGELKKEVQKGNQFV